MALILWRVEGYYYIYLYFLLYFENKVFFVLVYDYSFAVGTFCNLIYCSFVGFCDLILCLALQSFPY